MAGNSYGNHAKIDIAAEPTPKDVRRLRDMLVQVVGLTGVWDIQLEGSVDGAVWWPIETITTNTLVTTISAPELGLAWSHIRLRVATADTGTPDGYVRGRTLEG